MRNLKIILIISSLLASLFAFSQKDSMDAALKKMPNDANKIFALINAANSSAQSTPKKAFDYVEQGLKLSLELKNIRGEAYCYNTLGALYYSTEKYTQSIKYYKNSLILFEGLEKEKGYYSSMKNIGAAYEKNKEYQTAITYYNKFLTLAKNKKNEDDVVFATNGLARCNKSMKKFDETEVYYQQAYNIEKQRNNSSGIINAADNLGNFYETQNDSTKAFGYFDTSYAVATSNGLAVQSNNYFSNANTYYQKRGNIEQQIQVNQSAVAANTFNNNPSGVNEANLQLGKLNIQKNNSKDAISYLNKSVNLSEELGEIKSKEEALTALTAAYKDVGDFEKALQAYQELVRIQDSVQQEKNKQVLLANDLSLTIEQKEAKINLLIESEKLKEDKYNLELAQQESNNKRQLYIIYALIAGFLVLAVAAILVLKSNRERQKANMLLELKSLRTQMNPHFIFNSLNSINGFISKNDDRSANKYLSRFSQLMRLVLENSKHDFVTLESEVKILELYVELEHLRFQDKFDFKFTIQQNIELESIQVPPMLVQPYIENAVWHGLRYLENPGQLNISLEKLDNTIIWTIEDNGIGRQASEEIKTKNQQMGTSTGMKNISQRMELLNKMKTIQMTAEVIDLERGTKVIIKIPVS